MGWKTAQFATSTLFYADFLQQVHFALEDRGIVGAACAEAFVKMKAHQSRKAAAACLEHGPMRHWLGNHLVDRQAKQTCQLLGGRRTLAESAEAAAQRHSDILRALAVGIAALFSTLPKRPNIPPRSAKHGGEIICQEMVHRGLSGGARLAACRQATGTYGGGARPAMAHAQ